MAMNFARGNQNSTQSWKFPEPLAPHKSPDIFAKLHFLRKSLLINIRLQRDSSRGTGPINRFSGFPCGMKTAKAVLDYRIPIFTPLNRGVNGEDGFARAKLRVLAGQ